MSSRFTEQETEIYYDSEDAFYRSFWDEGGSVHWGVFDESTGDDFLKACANLNDLMVAKAGIDSSSRVLEDRKSTRLNSSHALISYAVFCLKKKTYKFICLLC